jgi:hypothetical protein
METHSMNILIRSAIAVSSALSVCGGALAQTEKTAAKLNYEETLVDEQNRKQQGGGGPLIDHGGPALASSKTYAIYWGNAGDFPTDLQSGMASLLSGFNGSSYLGIAQQYMRDAAISSTYGGSASDSSTPPRAPTQDDRHRCRGLQTLPESGSEHDLLRIYFQCTQNKLLRLARQGDLQRRHFPGGLCAQPGAAP